jgi:hypothetical protein
MFTYGRTLGYPNLTVCRSLRPGVAKVISHRRAGSTDALEFETGKLMLSKLTVAGCDGGTI